MNREMPARAKEATMQYALLIYDDEAAWEALSEAEMTSAMAGYYDFTDRVVQRGAHRAGEALNSVAAATSVRHNGTERLVTDGPFVETKEQLGGFYLVEVDSLDDAIELAKQIPVLSGGVEIRPVMQIPPREGS
jgi:hypothetical protein